MRWAQSNTTLYQPLSLSKMPHFMALAKDFSFLSKYAEKKCRPGILPVCIADWQNVCMRMGRPLGRAERVIYCCIQRDLSVLTSGAQIKMQSPPASAAALSIDGMSSGGHLHTKPPSTDPPPPQLSLKCWGYVISTSKSCHKF